MLRALQTSRSGGTACGRPLALPSAYSSRGWALWSGTGPWWACAAATAWATRRCASGPSSSAASRPATSRRPFFWKGSFLSGSSSGSRSGSRSCPATSRRCCRRRCHRWAGWALDGLSRHCVAGMQRCRRRHCEPPAEGRLVANRNVGTRDSQAPRISRIVEHYEGEGRHLGAAMLCATIIALGFIGAGISFSAPSAGLRAVRSDRQQQQQLDRRQQQPFHDTERLHRCRNLPVVRCQWHCCAQPRHAGQCH